MCSQALCFFPLVNYLANGLDIECCCLKQNAYRLLDYVSGESTQEIKKAIPQQIEIGLSNRELCRHGPRNYPTETKIGRENKALLRGTMNKEERKAQVNLFYLPLSIKSRWMRREREASILCAFSAHQSFRLDEHRLSADFFSLVGGKTDQIHLHLK